MCPRRLLLLRYQRFRFISVPQDPRGNLLRQWLAANSRLGIVSREFELSGDPPLGDWTIAATSNVSQVMEQAAMRTTPQNPGSPQEAEVSFGKVRVV